MVPLKSTDFLCADRSKVVILLCILLLFMSLVYLCYAALSVPCSLVISCWERLDVLCLLVVVFSCVFVTFLYGLHRLLIFAFLSSVVSSKCMIMIIMFPPTRGMGDILFMVRIPSSFVSVHYLLNQLMDFDQTCIVTLMGGGEELIRLLSLCSRSQGHLEMSKIWFPYVIF